MENNPVICGQCGTDKLLNLPNDKYRCEACDITSELVDECKYCGTLNTCDSSHDLEGSYLSGCAGCEGKDLSDV